MAYVLSAELRLKVLAGLVDGNSERAISRMTGVHPDTIGRFALRLGEGCTWLHNRIVRDLSCSLVEMDEIWSYVRRKQARVLPEHDPTTGDAWTWTGFDSTSLLTIAWHVGKRTEEDARIFVKDMRGRIIVMPRLMTSDGLPAYVMPIWEEFGPAVSYGQVIKNYRHGSQRGPDHRYEPPRDPFLTKRSVFGGADMERATTAHIERQNGTARHFTGRLRRLCYAFSKKVENHRAAVALFHVRYNLCWIPRTLRVTPAMAAGITKHPWELDEFMDAVLSAEPCEPPSAMPLAIPAPPTTARELPGGRGFLRVVPSGGDSPGPKAPSPAPAPIEPEASQPTVARMAPDTPKQLDLLSWVQPPREPKQLGLFD